MSPSDTDPSEGQRSLLGRVRDRPWLFGGLAVVLVGLLLIVLVVFQPQRLLYDEVVDDAFPTVEPAGETDDETMSEDPTGDPADGNPGDVDPGGGNPGDVDPGDGDPADGDPADGDVEGAEAADGDEMGEGGPGEDDGAQAGSDAMTSDTGDDAGDDVGDESDGSAGPPTGPLPLATGGFTARSRYTVIGAATVYELEDGSRTLRLEDFESTNGPSLYVYLTAADAEDPDGELDADHVDLGALRGNVGNQNYEVPADVDLEVYDTVVIWCRPFSVAFGAADLR